MNGLPSPEDLGAECAFAATRLTAEWRARLAEGGVDSEDCHRLLRSLMVAEGNLQFIERIYVTLDDDYAARNADRLDRWQRLRAEVLARLADDPTGPAPKLPPVTSVHVARALQEAQADD